MNQIAGKIDLLKKKFDRLNQNNEVSKTSKIIKEFPKNRNNIVGIIMANFLFFYLSFFEIISCWLKLMVSKKN